MGPTLIDARAHRNQRLAQGGSRVNTSGGRFCRHRAPDPNPSWPGAPQQHGDMAQPPAGGTRCCLSPGGTHGPKTTGVRDAPSPPQPHFHLHSRSKQRPPPLSIPLGGDQLTCYPKKRSKNYRFQHRPKPRPVCTTEAPPTRPPPAPRGWKQPGSCPGQLWPGRIRPLVCFPWSQRAVEAPVPGAVSSAAPGHRALLPFLQASSNLARNLLVTVVYKDHMHPRLTFNGKNLSAASSEVRGHPK